MANFKKGEAVEQVLPKAIAGVIAGFHVDQDNGTLQYLVEWTNDQGEPTSRYFDEDQLKTVAQIAPE